MKALKRLLAIVGGGIVGLVLIVFGVKEFFQSKSLQSKGAATIAEVTDAEERSGRRGRHSYYVSVHYKTDGGQQAMATERVSRAVYDEAVTARRIAVTYLPSDPNVCHIGPVETEFMNLGIGVFVMGCAAFTAFRKPE